MVNQTPICVKLDDAVLDALDLEVSLSTGKRNRIINDAVKTYLELLDAARYLNCNLVQRGDEIQFSVMLRLQQLVKKSS